MIFRELWSPKDERDLMAFLAAAREGDLTGALHALEGIGPEEAAQDRGLFDEWSSVVAARLADRRFVRSHEQGRALAAVLGTDLGFRGDEDDYYNPSNALLHRVLSRRLGMPILLSVVWMEVGRRAGIAVAGIGLPGHFIVRVGRREAVLADPFDRGAPLTLEDCRKKVESISGGSVKWRPDFLTESTSGEILERVLANLAGCYRKDFDDSGRYRTALFLSALRPDSAQRLLERAEVAEELGLMDAAHETYSEVVERFPETSEAQQAAERLQEDPERPTVN